MRTLFSIAALAAAMTAGSAADAQSYRDPRGTPTATLYELPGFRGRQTVIYGHAENLAREFNDMAMSGRFEGRWRVCEHSDYEGRCVDLEGDVSNLQATGLAQRVSSLRAYAERDDDRRDWDDDRGYGGGYRDDDDRRGGRYDSGATSGARNVFFPYPNYRGADIAATAGAADRFCRANGLGPASYFDSSFRSSRPVDASGRYLRPGPILRDVLCQRWGGR